MLLKCNIIYGGASIWDGAPDMRHVARAVVVPGGKGYGDGGVFDVTGKRLQESCLFRGVPNRHNIYKVETSPVNSTLVTRKAEGRFLFLGPIHNHYGHFIVSTLSRLWTSDVRNQDIKIVYTDGMTIENYFRIDYMREIFNALSLTEDRFVAFDEPTLVDNLLMPAPSFNENIGAYPAFKTLCTDIGRRILAAHGPGDRDDRPVYLTKEYLKSGVAKVVNEPALSAVLRERGYEIIAPETLSFSAQVQLFNSGRTIVGAIGSGFHTSAFTVPERPQPTLVVVNASDTLWSNHPTIDRLSTYKAIYLYDKAGLIARGADGDFGATFEFVGPEKLAVTLADCVEKSKEISSPVVTHGTREQSRHPLEPVRRPMGHNLTLGRPWKRSENSKGVVWRVDLGAAYRISGMKLLGRADDNVRIHFSRDGKVFHPAIAGNRPYADALPNVFIWTSWGHDYASHVRLTAPLGTFPFEDIEVFGEEIDHLDPLISPHLDPPLRLPAKTEPPNPAVSAARRSWFKTLRRRNL